MAELKIYNNFEYFKKLLEDRRPPVIFKEEEHEYWLGDKQLSGITERINDVLYGGNKYAGVPEHTMERARMRGSLIHKEIEEYYVGGILGFTDELQRFIELQEEHGFKVLANEYTVTDFERYSTNIDLILYNNEDIELCDIKSTAQLDKEYLSWQLSINAYLLEKIINMPITKLSAYWTRSGEIVSIERKSNEEVEKFLYSHATLEPQERLELSNDQAEKFISLQNEISRLKNQLKELENTENEFKQVFMEKMKENNIKSFDLGAVKITYIAPTTRKSFDSKKFELEHKELYGQYLKESPVKESLKITIRSDK
jgi:hypothetical protein